MKERNYLNELVFIKSKNGNPYQTLERELGSRVSEYRKKWEIAGKRKTVFKYPLHLNLELSFGCNLRCPFCIFSLPRKQQYYKANAKDKIPFDKYRQIIDEGVRHGLCSVSLNGYNEPLLKKDIVNYIKYAKKSGLIDISLHTNGLLLTPEFSRKLIRSGLTSILFSVDAATKLTYKKIRGSDKFEHLVNNIIDFMNIRKTEGRVLPLTRISFVKTNVNIHELDSFIAFWKDKIDYFAFQSFSNPFIGMPQYHVLEKQYRLEDNPFRVCSESYQRLSITCDGNVFPCCSNYGLNLPIGNIYRDSIYDIWHSKVLRDLRRDINLSEKQPLACRDCRKSFISNQDIGAR